MIKQWTPYPGCPTPTFEQCRDYINAATSPADRNFRKMQVHGFMYSSGTTKFVDVLKAQAALKAKEDKKGEQS